MRKYAIEIKWAVIFVAMTLLWMLLEKLAGLHSTNIDKHAIYTNFIAIPAVALYVFALRDKRANYYNGTMSYIQGFVTGIIISLIVTVLSPLTQYITSTIITPEYFPNVIQYVVEQGKMTQEAAENYFNLKSYIIQGLIGAPIMGIITAAIVAFFVKLKNNFKINPTMTTVNVYLNFNGNCEEAFLFYKSVFGGEFPYIGRFKEIPAQEGMPKLPKEMEEKIMHISLPVSKETTIMGSDTGGEWAPTFKQGNNFSISINTDSKEEATRLFNGLSNGGEITMPLNDTFWGDYFGMFTDKFGVNWMVSYSANQNQ